jgi:hypothetical protein
MLAGVLGDRNLLWISMRKIFKKLLWIFLGASIFIGQKITAEVQALPTFMKGWTYKEVLKEFGPPLSKDVKEIKREDIWHYEKQRVVFVNGKVTKFVNLAINDGQPQRVKPKKKEPMSEMDLILKDLVAKP